MRHKMPSLGRRVVWQERAISAAQTLSAHELHIWALPLSLSARQTEAALGLLNARQHDRYQRRQSAAQKEVYLAGRYYLLQLLAAYCAAPIEDLVLHYSRLGKPRLDAKFGELQFNFTDTQSDSGNIGLFAFARHQHVGVDIESRERRSDYSRIAQRKLTDAELNHVQCADGSINTERFLALWTRKEAYGKAIGKGVNFRMRDLHLASDDHAHQFSDPFDAQSTWQLEQFLVGDKHIGCAVYSGDTVLELQTFTSPAAASESA